MSKSGMLLFVLLLLPLAITKLVPAGRSVARRYGYLGAKREVPLSCVDPLTPGLTGSWEDKKCCYTKQCSPTNCCTSSSCTCDGPACLC
uniref:Conotoxin n=1 Tax=Conus betulinus TaxID=89764 RepID=A0A142C1K4_CONBE|nr:conotoxin [Conus betulinus]